MLLEKGPDGGLLHLCDSLHQASHHRLWIHKIYYVKKKKNSCNKNFPLHSRIEKVSAQVSLFTVHGSYTVICQDWKAQTAVSLPSSIFLGYCQKVLYLYDYSV